MPPMATYVIAAGGAEVLVSAQRFPDDSIDICAALGSDHWRQLREIVRKAGRGLTLRVDGKVGQWTIEKDSLISPDPSGRLATMVLTRRRGVSADVR